MGIKISTVERLIWRYWRLGKISPAEKNSIAADILIKAERASSLERFKLELDEIQVNRLRQDLDTIANNEVATRVFAGTHDA